MKTAGHLGALLLRCCMLLTTVPLQLAACSMVGLFAFTFMQHCLSDTVVHGIASASLQAGISLHLAVQASHKWLSTSTQFKQLT